MIAVAHCVRAFHDRLPCFPLSFSPDRSTGNQWPVAWPLGLRVVAPAEPIQTPARCLSERRVQFDPDAINEQNRLSTPGGCSVWCSSLFRASFRMSCPPIEHSSGIRTHLHYSDRAGPINAPLLRSCKYTTRKDWPAVIVGPDWRREETRWLFAVAAPHEVSALMRESQAQSHTGYPPVAYFHRARICSPWRMWMQRRGGPPLHLPDSRPRDRDDPLHGTRDRSPRRVKPDTLSRLSQDGTRGLESAAHSDERACRRPAREEGQARRMRPPPREGRSEGVRNPP